MCKICIQNLGQYNEGILNFYWLKLPATNEEIQKALDTIQVCNEANQYFDKGGCPYEEYMIADVEDFPFEYSEYANIDELNEMAKRYNNLSDTEQEAFEALKDYLGDEQEAFETVEDGNYDYIQADNDTDLAYELIDQIYGGVENLDKETLARYFDFEAFGRDCSYDYYQTDNGYIRAC